MKCSVGTSTHTDPSHAVEEATAACRSDVPDLVLFFSPVPMFKAAAEHIYKRFPQSVSAGTTTHFSFANGTIRENALTVICIESGLKCSGGVIQEITRYPAKYIPRIEECLQHFPHKSNLTCLEFTTADSFSEELVLDTLNSVCKPYGIQVVGGTAVSQNPRSARTRISAVALNGEVFADATVFLMIQNKNGRIRLYRESIYQITDTSFLATSVDIRKRLVKEFDHKPATGVLAKALNCSRQDLPQKLATYHLGRKSGNDVNVCSFDRIGDEGAVSWHTRIYNNSIVHIVQPVNYQSVTAETVASIKVEIPDPSFVFLLQCEGRFQFFMRESYLESFFAEYDKTFSLTASISVLGEQYGTAHLNHTLIAMVFE